MKNIKYIVFIALLGLFVSCEKDEVKVIMSSNPVAPEIISMPNLTLERNNGEDTLEFLGTNVDPGFQASANYFLEAAASGTNFDDVIQIGTAIQGTSFKITVSDLNGLMLKKFEADEATSVDFRLRSVLVVDAGTGAPGTSADPFEYISQIQTASVTTYGLPRLNLLNTGMDQKFELALGNGVYKGFVKVSPDMPFILQNPDTGTEYGGSGGVLTEGGSGIVVDNAGWHILDANTNTMTYQTTENFVGLVGSATPNGWDAPDQKMDYDAKNDQWYITLDLVVGHVKFRRNDGWAWNMGFVEGTTPGMEGPTQQGGVGHEIPISENGNYTVRFAIFSKSAGYYWNTKN